MSATLVALALPLLTPGFAPLVDFPNHLARDYILYHYGSDPYFHRWYERVMDPVPNLAMDLMLVAFQRVMSVIAAGKLFLGLLVVLYATSVHSLYRAIHGRASYIVVVAMFFVYNSMLLYGFVNYVLGLAVFNLALAAWLTARRRWSPAGLSGVAVLALLSYFTHLSAFLFFGAAVLVISLWDRRSDRRSWRAVSFDLLPAAVVFLVCSAITWRDRGTSVPPAWQLASKIVGVLPLIRTFDLVVDALVIALAAASVSLLYIHRQSVSICKSVVAAALLLFALFILGPWSAMTGTAVDQRFVPPAITLLVLAVKVRDSGWAARASFALAMAASALRLADISFRWRQAEPGIESAYALSETLPEHARVYPLYTPPSGSDAAKIDRIYLHVAHYAVITRRAYLPNTLAIRGQQPLIYRAPPPYHRPSDDGVIPGLASFDIVWTHGESPAQHAFLERCCTLRASRSGFSIWKVSNPSVSPQVSEVELR